MGGTAYGGEGRFSQNGLIYGKVDSLVNAYVERQLPESAHKWKGRLRSPPIYGKVQSVAILAQAFLVYVILSHV